MASRYRDAIAPAYLFLCLALGASTLGIWQNMVLQLLGVAIIAWAAWPGARQRGTPPARQLFHIALLAIAWVAIQMVPLPPSLWTHLGGRSFIIEGYRILGVRPPWLPLSVTPYRSLDSLLGLIPPLAIYVAVVSLGSYRVTWFTAALLLATIGGVVLGGLEFSGSGNTANSPWYLYPEASYLLPTGFFASGNYMASLLVCTLPFLAAVLAFRRESLRQSSSALIVAVAGAAIVIIVGVALSRSLAAYVLTPPVLAGSALILLPERSAWRRWCAIAAVFLLVAAVAELATTSVRGHFETDARSSAESRAEILATSGRAIGDFFPWGSGLGSFRSVYQLYEDPARVNDTYVRHAHNDYVELALETGLPGILLIVAFLAWWVRIASRAWRNVDAYARAASIASGAILLHSLVDFPLRTAAISALFAMCLSLLVQRPRAVARVRPEWRPARHVVIE